MTKIIMILIFLLFSLAFSDNIGQSTGESTNIKENPYSFNLFENMEGSERTFKTELNLISSLKDYRKRISELKEQLRSIKFSPTKYNNSPIESYRFLMKNFQHGFEKKKRTIFETMKKYRKELEKNYKLNTTIDGIV